MIDDYREQILSIIQEAGEDLRDSEEFISTRLGEGLGYTSLLWSVRVGARSYAVKITDTKSRLEEAKKIYGEDQAKIDSHVTLFAQQHNRELQAYRYLEAIRQKEKMELGKVAKFYGGVECGRDSVGIIIMADLGAESVSPDPRDEGFALETILSTVAGIAQFQTAYLSTDRECDLLSKDVLFVIGSAGVIKCIDSADKKGFLREEWMSAMLSWSTPEALREMQYGRQEGEPPLVLAHTDMWTNNMIFRRNEDGNIELLAFVDWQCATVGLALLDVASVVGMNMSAEARRKNEETILRHYLDAIEAKKSSFIREFRAEFESINLLYRRCLRFSALQLCLRIGSMLLTEPVGDSEEAIEKRRNHVEKRTILIERLKGILEDIVQ